MRSKFRVGGLCQPHDCVDHALRLLENFVVPEADHAEVAPLKKCGPFFIISDGILLTMLRAIELHDDLGVVACEVNDVGANTHLTSEVKSGAPRAAQLEPKQLLGVGRVLS